MAQLDGVRHLVLVDTEPPVSFFAYPDKPSVLVPDECEVHTLALGSDDVASALEHLADALGADENRVVPQAADRPEAPTGDLTAQTVANAIGATLPEHAIVSDEAATSGLFVSGATAGCPPHDWLTLTGGAIGQGLPVATGAAVACPDRKVLALQADGSAMYTIQALWTQAREGLDVTTMLFDNRSYAILNIELSRVGAGAGGPRAQSLLDLSNPNLDFVALAQGMGVDATRPASAEELTAALERSFEEPGPHLIDVMLPSRL
jgi:acetolactate synthase-1/2/3 large subunit